MSLKIDRVQLDIVINNDQARVQLRKLETEYKSLAKEQRKFTEGSAEWEKLKQKMLQVKMQMDKVYESIGIANLSLKELKLRQADLNAVLQHMSPSMKGYAELKAEADAVGKRIGELKGKAKEAEFSIGKMADGFNRYFALVTAGVASMTGLIFSFRKAVDVSNEYEKHVDNLSALTGLMGEEIDYLSKQAKELSTSTIEGNIRITSSADAIVDAYTKVGSKRPELLQVKEDLNAVTQEAMILAAAADGELEPAVAGLTMVLNQFNLPADRAREVINILAAGSKVGAGEIDYLTAGFEKSGSVANSFGIKVEELTGALETLAPRITEPEAAGRQLRNIMILLETQSDEKLKPSIVGLGGAFEYMARQQYTVTQLVDLFGQENINAANILMNNTAETKKYTEAVTGTSVALEQAAINTDNNASRLQQAKNDLHNVTIEFGEKLAPAMTFSTNVFGAFMRVVLDAPELVSRYNTALIAVTGLTLAYNANLLKSIGLKVLNHLALKEGIGLKIKDAVVLQAMIVKEQLYTIWKGNGTVAAKLATTAQYAWNAALSANPIGLVITAITALVVAIKTYDKYNAESIRLENEKSEAIYAVNQANSVLQKSYEVNKEKIQNLNKLSIEQKKALLDQVDATLKQAEAELELAKAKQINIEKENTRTTLWQTFMNSVLSNGNTAAFMAREATDAVMNGIDAAGTMNAALSAIANSIKQLRGQSGDLNEIVNAEKYADQITGKSISQLEEKQRYLTTALKNYEKGSADYIRISKKIADITSQLQQGTDTNTDSNKKASTSFEKLQAKIQKANAALVEMLMNGQTPPAEFIANLKNLEQKVIDITNATNVAKSGLESYLKVATDGVVDDNGDYSTAGDKNPITGDFTEEDLRVFEDLENRKKAILQQGIEGAKNLLTAASQAQYDHDVRLMDAKYDREKQKLEDQLNSNAISREQYDAKVQSLDKKRSAEEAKLQRKKAIREKEIASLGIGVEAAKAIFEIKAKAAAFLAGVTTAPLAAVALAQIPWVLGAAALQAGLIWAQPMPQAFTGRYNVTGAMDGRKYNNVPYAGNANTGMYTHPTLIADHGSEIVIDHLRSRNIQMNYPEILEAIRAVPQHYAGRVPAPSSAASAESTAVSVAMIDAMLAFSDAVKTLKQDGVHLDYQRLKDMTEKESAVEKTTAM